MSRVRVGFSLLFAFLAAVGLVLSFVAHVGALFGVALLGRSVIALLLGLFVVWAPVCAVGNGNAAQFKRDDWWKAALRGCPVWMKRAPISVQIYAFVGLTLLNLSGRADAPAGSGIEHPANVGPLTAGLMLFYSIAVAILYSGARIPVVDAERQCEGGHRIGPIAESCEECGRPVRDRSKKGRAAEATAGALSRAESRDLEGAVSKVERDAGLSVSRKR